MNFQIILQEEIVESKLEDLRREAVMERLVNQVRSKRPGWAARFRGYMQQLYQKRLPRRVAPQPVCSGLSPACQVC